MHIGILGPSQSGKTTIFKALSAFTSAQAGRKNEPSRAVVKVPDPRVDALSAMFNPKKTTYATIEYMDTLHPGGSDPYPYTYLQNFRSSDALAIVLPMFSYEKQDTETQLNNAMELYQELDQAFILNDLLQVEKKLESDKKALRKKNDAQTKANIELMERLLPHLEAEKPLRDFEFTPDEEKQVRGFTFMSQKPQVLILNIAEDLIPESQAIKDKWQQEQNTPAHQVLVVPGTVEADLVELPEDEAELFLEEYGLTEAALPAFMRSCYATLRLISFFTVGEDEVRAWTIPKDITARKAAGAIHSDLERGFIRAEVISDQELLELGSLKAGKDTGKLRLEGKEYIVQDGDIMHIRFNV